MGPNILKQDMQVQQYIPMIDFYIKKRVTNHLSVYATELLAVLLALQRIEEKKINNTVIASHSYSSHESIRSGRSSFRMDIIVEICCMMYNIKVMGISTRFFWVPAHVGVEGNEKVDILAKQTLRIKQVDLNPINKTEAKLLIRTYEQLVWQVYWDNNKTGRHLYNI